MGLVMLPQYECGLCTKRGMIAFADSGTVLRYCIDQTFRLHFGSIWTFLRHTITMDVACQN